MAAAAAVSPATMTSTPASRSRSTSSGSAWASVITMSISSIGTVSDMVSTPTLVWSARTTTRAG